MIALAPFPMIVSSMAANRAMSCERCLGQQAAEPIPL
jgi:hypothetical protein